MSKRKRTEGANFWLVCFKYAPGNWQHIESFTVQAEENGYGVHLILSKCFSWMTGSFLDKATYVTRSNCFPSILLDTFLFFLYRWVDLWLLLRNEKPQTIVLVMWHPLNAVFCFMAKVVSNSRIVVWLHEPYKKDKRAYGAKAVVFCVVEWIQTLAMPWIDDVVVHSKKALRAFHQRYPNAKQTARMIPLHFRDQPGQQRERQLISFLGKAAKAKGIDAFFELVETSASRNFEWKFGIATCDNISDRLAKMSRTALGNLEIAYNPKLPDAELREMASRSLASLCLYTSSMQSGVVPVAFMCGTPVIATDIDGLREFVDQGKTGYFVPLPARPDAIFEGLTYIKKNFFNLSRNCRQKFLTTYDDRKWKDAYGWLCDENRRKSQKIL